MHSGTIEFTARGISESKYNILFIQTLVGPVLSTVHVLNPLILKATL